MKHKPCLLGAAVVLAAYLAACTPDRVELHRAVSPTGAYAAVVVQEDAGGAAGSRATVVYLFETDGNQRRPNPVFAATRCESVIPIWLDSTTLEIQYTVGCAAFAFRSYWYPTKEQRDRASGLLGVEIILERVSAE